MKNWKTTAAGILSALIGMSGPSTALLAALQAMKPTPDYRLAIAGAVLTFVFGVARIWIGLLQNDAPPNLVEGTQEVVSKTTSTTKLGALALAVLMLSAGFTTGCTGNQVAQDIVNWVPVIESGVSITTSVVATLAPADAAIIQLAVAGFDTLANQLSTQAQAYLANPNTTILGQLQTQIVTFQQTVNASLLQAGQIKDVVSQQKVLQAIQTVSTGVTAILALVVSISKGAAKTTMVQKSTIKISQIEPLLRLDVAQRQVAEHYRESAGHAAIDVTYTMVSLEARGF